MLLSLMILLFSKITPTYDKRRLQGERFQKFVRDVVFKSLGITIEYYKTQNEQINIGESKQGIEVKYDRLTNKTGNLYIEFEERRYSNTPFVPSGILRTDNTYIYLVGDRKKIHLFLKEELKRLYEFNCRTNTYDIVDGKDDCGNVTSHGMLINAETDGFLFAKIIICVDNNNLIFERGDLEQLRLLIPEN